MIRFDNQPTRAVPYNLEAEQVVLGLVMPGKPGTLADVRKVLTGPEDFYVPSHEAAFAAVCSIADSGVAPHPIIVADRLANSPHPLAAADFIGMVANAPGGAIEHAELVREAADCRRMVEASNKLRQAAYAGDVNGAEPILTDALVTLHRRTHGKDRFVDGATFVASEQTLSPIWGQGDEVLWPSGEALYICGPTGIGKSTLAQQVVLAQMGLRTEPLLGLPVAADLDSRVLYLAMDRPSQVAKSLRRMVDSEQLDELARRLVVWQGPPDRDLAGHPGELLAMAHRARASVVVVDSLKDAAIKLTDDEVGARWNRAVQICLAEGVDVIVLHHQRKGQGIIKPKTIGDVYGSTWITAGAGSVVLLWGAPGDPTVELIHLKQPITPVGPLKIQHDHRTGSSTVVDEFDLLAALRASRPGLTAPEAARQWFGGDFSDSHRKRAKRVLDGYVDRGLAHRKDARGGGRGGTDPARYFAAAE